MAVYHIVYRMLEQGGWTHQQIADEVRRQIPEAHTTAKSVASHASAWKRQRGNARAALLPSGDKPLSKTAGATGSVHFTAPQPIQPFRRAATLVEIGEVIGRAKALASDYYRLTGRPLGITGEVGEYEAARLLGLALAPARAAGYDAVDGLGRKLQVKTRSLPPGAKPGQQVGGIKLHHEWDAVLLVLLDNDLSPTSIWEAARPAIESALLAPGSRARNERGALAISKFKSIGRLVWKGQEAA